MKRHVSATALAALFLCAPAAQSTETYSNPLTSLADTSLHEVVAEPVRYKGFDGLHVTVSPDHKSIEQGGCDNCTYAALEGVDFNNGTIELEVAGKPTEGAPDWARGFVGIIFRANLEKDTYEGVYLRPMNADAETQIQRNHTIQYFSYPDHPWHLLREKTPGHYESYAPVKVGEWTHMRLDIDGQTLRLYLNRAETPALVVNDLKLGLDQRGTVGLFTEPATDAYFRNLTVTSR